MAAVALLATVAAVCVPSAPLGAHPLSVSYGHVVVGEAGVSVRLRLPLDDMDLLLRVDRDLDGTITDAEIAGAGAAMLAYVKDHGEVRVDGAVLSPTLTGTARWADESAFPYAELMLTYPVARAGRLDVTYRLLADLYPDHRTLLDIEWGGRREQFVAQHGNTYSASAAGSGWLEHLRTFLVLGVEHILTGYDHLLFLLGLLVAGRRVRDVVTIVTAFTVAHSVTLAVATLGFVSPPARIVEAVIALSIAYVGVENLFVTAPRRRWQLAFGFGLIHGFGFASILRDMDLPRESLAASLVTFNLGVEMGQLAVVLVAWPLLMRLQRTAHDALIRRGLSAAVTAFGLYWFAERIM